MKHWWAICLITHNGTSSELSTEFISTNRQAVTKKDMEQVNAFAIVSVSYLGYMTEQEFGGENLQTKL